MTLASNNDDDRALLQCLSEGPCSGPHLAALLGVGRAGVWKRIQGLRKAGLMIDVAPGQGYRMQQPIEWLAADRIGSMLAPESARRLDRLEVVWEIDSTNSEMLRRESDAHCEVLFAERQFAGRGRRGRGWVTPLGAQLAFSLRRRFDHGIGALAGLSLAVGAAAADGLAAAGYPQIGLKWPNDLMVDGRKLGGILIELGGEYAGPARVVIGIGINLALPPAAVGAIDQPWIDLRQLDSGRALARNKIAAALLDALLPALDQFEAEGLAPFQARWHARDVLRGREVTVIGDGPGYVGVALGIADNGALRVRHANGERLHHGGEVSVRSNASRQPGCAA
ncbi:MAG: biotin--[acetyl-CoA-carboxylase] ligase [Lysobacteraceae bacterium]